MTFREAMRTTLEELEIYNMAYAIQQEDKRLNSAIQAWFNQSVKAQKGRGKSARPAFKNFEEFYNHKEEFDRKDALLRSINAQVQSFKDSIR